MCQTFNFVVICSVSKHLWCLFLVLPHLSCCLSHCFITSLCFVFIFPFILAVGVLLIFLLPITRAGLVPSKLLKKICLINKWMIMTDGELGVWLCGGAIAWHAWGSEFDTHHWMKEKMWMNDGNMILLKYWLLFRAKIKLLPPRN
jgi:hypothetical protein